MAVRSEKVTFKGALGEELAARLDRPEGPPRAYALFAHCFTCSKDIFAASRIASALAERGIAVLRFDFTGLGMSGGDFSNTNFSSNVADLVAAADFLRETYEAPDILVGHSLGGAAVLAAAEKIPEAAAIATIGAPADAAHVAHNFGEKICEINENGEAEVMLAGRSFTIKQQFLDDIETSRQRDHIGRLKKALLIFHAPLDEQVGIDNASEIFLAAKHPKSFVSLDNADHLLTRKEDAVYVAGVLTAWAQRYIEAPAPVEKPKGQEGSVSVAETGAGKFQQKVQIGPHSFLADEPESVGGMNSGPAPYDWVLAGLGACTSMTLRMYADAKKWPLKGVSVRLEHNKVHAEDCEDCEEKPGAKIDLMTREIALLGDLSGEQRARLMEIADKCPVHRTLESKVRVETRLADEDK
ncbi:OsmC family protein [Tepidicaulis marinus]|uniref:OsmC family protein n=1 Tax=Tepidicaulis marinus TaxID=1333998 RepID=A0A081BAV1_9HYPH|nr:bifunctional alpha/beta hydrolase/OsmC family protein [Tepidicaulis marinus]GAK45169.1 OsmC family protein [Tepidicaulis marinus]